MIGKHQPLRFTVGFAVLAVLLSGCDNTVPVAETPPPPVSVSQPVLREVVDHDDFEGRIAAVDTQEVRSRARGYLIKVNFQDGQLVKKGELLFEIDPAPYQATLDGAEAQKAAAEAALKFAKAEYQRVRALVSKNAASREELETWVAKQAVSAADVLKADASIEQAKLDLGYTKIKAPIDGKTSRTQVTAGNLVNAGGGETLLTTIVLVHPMYVYFDVDERALMGYRRHFRKTKDTGGPEPSLKDLKIPVKVGLEGEEGYPHEGVIDFADNRVNPGTGTIQVRGVLPNTKRILDAGMRARVRVPVSDPHESLLITERAIGTDQGIRYVYVVNDQNVVERRDVKLGRLSDGLQVILNGVHEKDRVIVNGIQRVRDGAKVDPKEVTMPGTPAAKTNPETKS
jgi:RND family efflux transporter MFP subunit